MLVSMKKADKARPHVHAEGCLDNGTRWTVASAVPCDSEELLTCEPYQGPPLPGLLGAFFLPGDAAFCCEGASLERVCALEREALERTLEEGEWNQRTVVVAAEEEDALEEMEKEDEVEEGGGVEGDGMGGDEEGECPLPDEDEVGGGVFGEEGVEESM
jgi:hypothetical protein